MALALSGRLSSTVATPPAKATLSVSKFGFMFDSSFPGAQHLFHAHVEQRRAGEVLPAIADHHTAGDIRSQGRREERCGLTDVIHRTHTAQRNVIDERR